MKIISHGVKWIAGDMVQQCPECGAYKVVFDITTQKRYKKVDLTTVESIIWIANFHCNACDCKWSIEREEKE